ncbi:MAG: trypsin-like serine protease [Chloroflexi bacterium]|nr:trypsin-like serine protease [Chloroflexota bacterium]
MSYMPEETPRPSNAGRWIVLGCAGILVIFICSAGLAAALLPRLIPMLQQTSGAGQQPTIGVPQQIATALIQRTPTRAQEVATPIPAASSPANPTPGAGQAATSTVARPPAQATSPARPSPRSSVVIIQPTSGAPSIDSSLKVSQDERPKTAPTPFPAVSPAAISPEEQVLQRLYQKVNPSVVNIDVLISGAGLGGQDSLQPASASGFVISKEGHIVTNNHVVDGAQQIRVTFADGYQVNAKVMGVDPDSDLAVIKVNGVPADSLVPVAMGDSSQVKPGQKVVAIGNPFAYAGSMTFGIISAVGRTIPSGLSQFSIPLVIQTDAPINPGNSGGPLVDLDGRVVGVNAQIRSDTARANSGVGFAIPSNIVKLVAPDLITKGQHDWAWLGLQGTSMNFDLAQANNLPQTTRGAYIDAIVAGGPAAKGGLKGSSGQATVDNRPVPNGGDIIIQIDNQPVNSFDDLLTYVSLNTSPSKQVQLKLWRNGQQTTVTITMEARPRQVQ